MKIKKIVALILLATMLATSISACGGSSDTGDLTVSLGPNPETIDPALNMAVDACHYLHHLFEGLMRYKWDGSGIEYGQAESHTVSADGIVWTFTLRDGLKWSDGEPLTAADYVYAWQRLVDPATAAPYAFDMGQYILNGTAITEGRMGPAELGVRAIDARTLEVTLADTCPFFLEIVAFTTFSPVRRDMIETHGDRWTRGGDTYISNGAFRMESFALDDRLVVVKNEHYWDADSIIPARITFLFLRDSVASLTALRAGHAVLVDSFPGDERDALIADGLYQKYQGLGTAFLEFNMRLEIFQDPLVRKALILAVDNAYIANTVLHGSYTPATAFVGDGFYTSGHDVEFRSEGQMYFDPDGYEEAKTEAVAALAAAGYPGGEGFPRLEYLYVDSSGNTLTAEAIQGMWKDVLGITLDLQATEWATMLVDARAGNFQILPYGWMADFNDPSSMLGLFISTSANNNSTYNNPEYDRLMALSMSETDPAARSALLHRAEDILLGEDYAVAPLYYFAGECAADPQLRGFGVSALGYFYFHQAYMEQ